MNKFDFTLEECLEDIKRVIDEDHEIQGGYLEPLYNHITNLQKENEKYKKIFEGKERFSKIMPEDIDFIILSKSDYDRQEKDIQLELIDYKSRCEKAIEYINKNILISFDKVGFKTDKVAGIVVDNLLNILNGGDE